MARMIHRSLFAWVMALLLVLAPSAVAAQHGGAVMADDMPAMASCANSSPSKSRHDKSTKSCCIALCTAVAVTPSASVGAAAPQFLMTYFAAGQSWLGFLGEIATPPPRFN